MFSAVALLLPALAFGKDARYFSFSTPQVRKCSLTGSTDNIRLDEDKIRLVDSSNLKAVNYFRFPGSYAIEFRDVTVQYNDVPFAAFDVAAWVIGNEANLLQLKNFSALPALRDGSYKCDNYSSLLPGSTNRKLCRFCNVCSSLETASQGLQKRKMIPGADQRDLAVPDCTTLRKGQSYTFKQAIFLPELEEFLQQPTKGGDKDKDQIKEGVVHLSLEIYEKPRMTTAETYCEVSCRLPSSLKCNECQTEYQVRLVDGALNATKHCLSQKNQQLSGCYDITLGFRLSEDFVDVLSSGGSSPLSGDPCAKELADGKAWCRGCWFCSRQSCSEPCACHMRRECLRPSNAR